MKERMIVFKKMKENICVDFDGVLNLYTKWCGDSFFPPLRPGAKEFLETLQKEYNIIIFSCRNPITLKEWLLKNHLPFNEVIQKPRAVAYIDDHGINFNKDFSSCLSSLYKMIQSKI